MHVWLDPPVPVVRGEGRVLVEESRLPADHCVVAQHVSLADPDGAQVVEAVHVAGRGDPGRGRPVRPGNEVVFGSGGCRVTGCSLCWEEGYVSGEMTRMPLRLFMNKGQATQTRTRSLTLNSSLNGLSLKKIQGYPNRRFQCNSSCCMLCRMPSSSSLRTRLMSAARGRREIWRNTLA